MFLTDNHTGTSL